MGTVLFGKRIRTQQYVGKLPVERSEI